MNLFILSSSQKQIAEWMFDCHIVKIILEAVQMLCTAKLLLDADDPTNDKLYKISHKNHPVSIWVRKSYENYIWTLKLVYEMHNEWRFRYNHPKTTNHKSYIVAYHLLKYAPSKDKFECSGLTPFATAMPDEYKIYNDPIECYKKYYMSEPKQKLAKWRKREKPEWYILNNSTP
jgi:hypothetical protein